ncbi:hypothetical protein K2173_023681 [Erythroxylum novogranatense]|uniref:Reverse transcriptase Ty1/copia-type domain-containing protein n=1 Tax=Erythroxylum novogranatense TaxID=1862640 RepID=A0AAV8TPC0_9ROSI|nr:hypothetical protein K2173_023681 [Erythroxylum novogranatense]
MDVKTAFLNGNLAEDVYMTQPKGFTSYDGEKVCKLQKSIYGLKQASRSWNIRFDEVIKEFGFSQNPDEYCVYKKVNGTAIYLRRTKDVFLIYGDGDLKVSRYTDANFQSDKDDSKSQSGYVFTLNGEAQLDQKFITELGVVPSCDGPMQLYCDNNGAIA